MTASINVIACAQSCGGAPKGAHAYEVESTISSGTRRAGRRFARLLGRNRIELDVGSLERGAGFRIVPTKHDTQSLRRCFAREHPLAEGEADDPEHFHTIKERATSRVKGW